MQSLSYKRNDHEEWWGSHFPYEGDLVGMSYLYFEKKFHKQRKRIFESPDCISNKKVNLVLWGDSYTQFIPDTAYCATSFRYGRRYFEKLHYNIDSTAKNVLIIEITERLIRDYFRDKNMFNEVVLINNNSTASAKINYVNNNKYAGVYIPVIDSIGALFNTHINQNLEYNLFNYNIINPIRHAKALMNYRFFSRASGNVILSADKEYLFLKETVQGNKSTSFSKPLSEAELLLIVNTLNEINDYYIRQGFDDVYLSIIPNPVTVLQPEGYNLLIPRLQGNTKLLMKCIDMYSTFKKTKEEVYWRGDTHWNNKGAQIWLNVVNELLQKDTL